MTSTDGGDSFDFALFDPDVSGKVFALPVLLIGSGVLGDFKTRGDINFLASFTLSSSSSAVAGIVVAELFPAM